MDILKRFLSLFKRKKLNKSASKSISKSISKNRSKSTSKNILKSVLKNESKSESKSRSKNILKNESKSISKKNHKNILSNKSINHMLSLERKDFNKRESMNKFIHHQIDSYNNQKFDLRELVTKYKHRFFIIEIINNKLKVLVPNYGERAHNTIVLLAKMLKKYKIKNTILFINLADGNYFLTNDVPVFNFSVPEGNHGMIIPEFDVSNVRLNKKMDLNTLYKHIIKYKPKEILNDIYFVGSASTERKNKLRELLSAEKAPFHVDLSGATKVEMWDFKSHKYLLDLPGFKPWSIRFKFLLSTQRPIIRVSLHNSKYSEHNFWHLWFDYLLKPNQDYIQLTYDCDYDTPLSDELYQKIKSDILSTYHYLEHNEIAYKKIAENGFKASQNISIDESLFYLYTLIETYTKRCSEKPIN